MHIYFNPVKIKAKYFLKKYIKICLHLFGYIVNTIIFQIVRIFNKCKYVKFTSRFEKNNKVIIKKEVEFIL